MWEDAPVKVTIAANRNVPSVQPAPMGKMSVIETYRHHPRNRPKARNPIAFAARRSRSVSRIVATYSGGMENSNRISQAATYARMKIPRWRKDLIRIRCRIRKSKGDSRNSSISALRSRPVLSGGWLLIYWEPFTISVMMIKIFMDLSSVQSEGGSPRSGRRPRPALSGGWLLISWGHASFLVENGSAWITSCCKYLRHAGSDKL